MANVLNNDIYDLVSSVQDIEERYIPEEAPETLALGIYGYLEDIHATILQNSAIATGELGNELFPGRAKFERNVISHAIIQNIENLNAVPATISAIFGIFEEDLDKYMVLDKFIIDKENIKLNNIIAKPLFSNPLVILDKTKQKYTLLLSKLDALSPLKTLERGYGIIKIGDKAVTSIKDLKKDDLVNIELKDGSKEAIIK